MDIVQSNETVVDGQKNYLIKLMEQKKISLINWLLIGCYNQ